MKSEFKKQFYIRIIYGMISILLFSCSASHKTFADKTGKSHGGDDDGKFKALYYDGMKQKVTGNINDALSFFEKCLAINPASPAANFEVFQILEENKQYDSARTYIERAVKGDEENIWYRYFYAQNLEEASRFKEVVKVYEDLIKMHPGATDFYYKLALAQLQAQEYKQAIETYDALEQKAGVADEDLVMNKIEILEKTKDYGKAELEIQKLIKKDTSKAQNYDMLGGLYETEGKREKAFAVYQRTEALHPHDPMVHLSLADYYKTSNEDKMAFIELEKAFDEPALDIDTKIRIILGLNTFTNADSIFNEAMTLSRKMVQSNPTESRAHAVYGELLQHNQNVNEARTQYRLAVSNDSSRYNYWESLLDIELQLNDWQALESESGKAIGLFPNNAQIYYDNGLANMQLKKYNEAFDAFKSGAFYMTNDSGVMGMMYAYMGDMAYYTKRFSTSDSAYELALKLNPNNVYVLNNYSYFLSVRDTNLGEAEQMSKKSNELNANDFTFQDTYAWILYKLGKYQDAKEWEGKAIAHGGEVDAAVAEHYGDILFKTGDKDLAMEYWIKAKKAGANSELLERKIKDRQLYEK